VKNRQAEEAKTDALWYKDAIIYELHIKSFCDSDGDGVGDIPGLISKLDYLQDLGVTALWLLPFYPSPLKDDGYDISDYYGINPSYGALKDFKEFLKQAHSRGMKVITELVLNHTSDKHPWFERARTSSKGSKHRDYYVWSGTTDKYRDARIIFKDFESSNWAWDPVAGEYYWHRFYSHQPDLNFENPEVKKAMFDVIDYWFKMGVDGMRLDAVPYLFEKDGTNCENLPETHAFLKELRKHVDSKFKNKMLLAEANQWPEDAIKYFGDGDECNMAFHFPVMPRMFMAIQLEDRFPLVNIMEGAEEKIPDNAQWAMFLRNHDELTLEMVTDEERDSMYSFYAADPRAKINLGIRRRLAPLLWNNRRKVEVMNILLLSMPGTPVIYYGDEIGMGDNYYLGDRDGVRTPMQWNGSRNAGFSGANPQQLFLPVIIDPEYHYETVNVDSQQKNLSSLLWWTKRVIAMRKKYAAFGRGTMKILSPPNPKVFAFIREYGDEKILGVINLSRFSQPAEIDLSEYEGMVPEEAFSQNRFARIKKEPYVFTLGPYNYFWMSLINDVPSDADSGQQELPVIEAAENTRNKITAETVSRLERAALEKYIRTARWFGGKGRTIRRAAVSDSIPAASGAREGAILVVEVTYTEGRPETYIIPVFTAWGKEAGLIESGYPHSLIARASCAGESGVIYDSISDPDFHAWLFDLMRGKKRVRGKNGGLEASVTPKFSAVFEGRESAFPSHVIGAEQSNNSIVYNSKAILKIFRRCEEGENPEVEILNALTGPAGFSFTPDYYGMIRYSRPDKQPSSAAAMQAFVVNEGDAWSYALEHVGKFYERIFTRKEELEKSGADMTGQKEEAVPEEQFRSLVGEFFINMISLLGTRTGEMHLALSSPKSSGAFAPEPLSLLYQRSVYQSMKNSASAVFNLLDKNKNRIEGAAKEEVKEIISLKGEIDRRIKRMTDKKLEGKIIRIHGDYHLGQVLFTGNDFAIIDFEGEPARPLSERRLKRTPVCDIAGMLRSFHYVAYASLLKHPAIRPEDAEKMEPWAIAWYRYVAEMFKGSYLEKVKGSGLVPEEPEDFAVLNDAYMINKALYEIAYEANNRPDWIMIPVRGIKAITAKEV